MEFMKIERKKKYVLFSVGTIVFLWCGYTSLFWSVVTMEGGFYDANETDLTFGATNLSSAAAECEFVMSAEKHRVQICENKTIRLCNLRQIESACMGVSFGDLWSTCVRLRKRMMRIIEV
jgi:hypothetical protein